MSIFYSRGLTRTVNTQLARWGEGTIPGKQVFIRWEQDITWVYNTITTYRLFINGVRVEWEGRETCDCYNWATSPSVREAQALFDEFKITPAHSPIVEVRIKSDIEARPAMLIKQEGRPEFNDLSDNRWYVGDPDIFDEIESFDWNGTEPVTWTPNDSRLQRFKPLQGIPLWSSREPIVTDDELRQRLLVAIDRNAAFLEGAK